MVMYILLRDLAMSNDLCSCNGKALSLVQPTGGNDAANAAPKLPGEHIYSKVNKPSKPLTTDKNGGQSPNVAARPEKGKTKERSH